jgi:hypothetical protein
MCDESWVIRGTKHTHQKVYERSGVKCTLYHVKQYSPDGKADRFRDTVLVFGEFAASLRISLRGMTVFSARRSACSHRTHPIIPSPLKSA